MEKGVRMYTRGEREGRFHVVGAFCLPHLYACSVRAGEGFS